MVSRERTGWGADFGLSGPRPESVRVKLKTAMSASRFLFWKTRVRDFGYALVFELPFRGCLFGGFAKMGFSESSGLARVVAIALIKLKTLSIERLRGRMLMFSPLSLSFSPPPPPPLHSY